VKSANVIAGGAIELVGRGIEVFDVAAIVVGAVTAPLSLSLEVTGRASAARPHGAASRWDVRLWPGPS
jgi:hypothetical protein